MSTSFYGIINFQNPIYGNLDVDDITRLGELKIENISLAKNISLIRLFFLSSFSK